MNSIEEDIKILKDLAKILDKTCENNNCEQSRAIENLIKAYKELEEIEENHRQENGKLRERVKELEENINKQKQLTKIAQTITDESIKEALIEFEKDYIPVSLVEETIKRKKEYKLKYEQEFADNKDENYFFDINAMDKEIQVLQELLEKR